MRPVSRRRLCLLATTCLLIAAKMHESAPPTVAVLTRNLELDSASVRSAVRPSVRRLLTAISWVFTPLLLSSFVPLSRVSLLHSHARRR